MVAVTSATLIGAYTIPRHYIKQLTQRLSVMYVVMGRTKCPDQVIQEYLAATGLEMGSMGELMINTLGPLLAITSDTTFDVNGQVREFVATADLRDRYDWSGFEQALNIQLRLVYDNFQSTTVRFAISSLKAFEYVCPLALSIMCSQADILKELDKDLEGRPYTGCVSPVPDKFTVAQQPHMCLYGLLYYEKICSAEARDLFKDYVKESTRKKVPEEDIHTIEILVDQTPPCQHHCSCGYGSQVVRGQCRGRYQPPARV
jgi:hypothetical protein